MTVLDNDTIERDIVSGVGPYAFNFRIFDATDLRVTACSTATPSVPTQLTYLTDYTVAGVNSANGGTITLVASRAVTYAGYTLDIRSMTPNDQPTSIRNIGRFLPEVHEDAFDHLQRQIQDLRRQLAACVRYPDNTLLDGTLTPLAAWVSNYLTINSSGALTPAALSATAITSAIVANLFAASTVDQDALLALLTDRTDTAPGLISLRRTALELATNVTPVNYAYEPFDLRRYGLTPDGTTDNTTLFASLVTAIGANPAVFLVNGGDFVIGTTSVPKNITLHFRGNGRILAKAAGTLTISGAIDASDRQSIFTGTGTIATGAGIHRLSNPWWFGAIGNGVTDDVSAVQKALIFAGDLGEILINGRFLCRSGLTLGRWARLRGQSFALGNPTASSFACLVTDMTSGYFITCASVDVSMRNAPLIENLTIFNSTGAWGSHIFSGNTCTAFKVIDNIVCDRVKIEGFSRGLELTNSSFYARFRTTEWLTCSIAIYSTTPAYNITCLDCKSALVSSFHNASNSANATVNLKIIGGSIEHYSDAIDQVINLSLFGTYFETDTPSAFGMFSTQALNNISVAMFGCTIYLNNHDRFVNLSGRTAVSLSSHGNGLHGDDASATGAYMYYLPTTGTIDIGGDVVTSTWNSIYAVNENAKFCIQYPLGVGSDNLVLNGCLSGSATYDPPSLADGAGTTTTVTVTGATLGDSVDSVSFSLDLQSITVTAYVSAANTVAVRFQNESGGVLDLASGTLRVRVRK